MIFSIIKIIFDVIAYSTLFILIFTLIYVKRGGEINIKYEEDDDKDEESNDDENQIEEEKELDL